LGLSDIWRRDHRIRLMLLAIVFICDSRVGRDQITIVRERLHRVHPR
jgi:hypothetical protein